jgi:hypothetical protein
VLEEVEYLLQNAVRMSVTAPARLRRDSVLTVQVTIANNITGHDIPTGSIFMRQMWVELIVRKNGRPASFWEAHAVEFRTIPAFDSRTARYRIPPPAGGWREELELSVRLRFRAFPPYMLRALGLGHLVERLPIFDMEWEQRSIALE